MSADIKPFECFLSNGSGVVFVKITKHPIKHMIKIEHILTMNNAHPKESAHISATFTPNLEANAFRESLRNETENYRWSETMVAIVCYYCAYEVPLG